MEEISFGHIANLSITIFNKSMKRIQIYLRAMFQPNANGKPV